MRTQEGRLRLGPFCMENMDLDCLNQKLNLIDQISNQVAMRLVNMKMWECGYLGC